MLRKDLEILNRLGLHARAAAKFVRVAGKFSCSVTVGRGDTTVDGKSILGVLLLAAPQGTVLEIVVDGDDEEAALTALTELVGDKFGED